jgi:hypothetical protein
MAPSGAAGRGFFLSAPRHLKLERQKIYSEGLRSQKDRRQVRARGYPSIPMFQNMRTVNLHSNNPHLLNKLGGRNIVLNDHSSHSLQPM